MEMLEMTQGSTSIIVQIGGDSTDVMSLIVHHSLRVCIHYEHVPGHGGCSVSKSKC